MLADACSWREVAVDAIDATGPRARVDDARRRPRDRGASSSASTAPAGAVLEASILASRVRRLPAAEVRAELARLAVVVDKTAGPRERAAMDRPGARAHELIPALERAVATAPLDERARGQLMLALYRDGRQTEALARYRSGRRRLVDEVGVEPGNDLRASSRRSWPRIRRSHSKRLR